MLLTRIRYALLVGLVAALTVAIPAMELLEEAMDLLS